MVYKSAKFKPKKHTTVKLKPVAHKLPAVKKLPSVYGKYKKKR